MGWKFALATVAIVGTQIGCAWVIVSHLDSIDPTYELRDIGERISKISAYVESISAKSEEIESNTEELLMTPQERLQKSLERLRPAQPTK